MKHIFRHRGVRIEVWQGNDNEAKLGYISWFWRTASASGPVTNHKPWATKAATIQIAKYEVDKWADGRAK